jgi:hypothetical protein
MRSNECPSEKFVRYEEKLKRKEFEGKPKESAKIAVTDLGGSADQVRTDTVKSFGNSDLRADLRRSRSPCQDR